MDILLKFNDADEVVKIIYSGGNVKEFLNAPSLECPLIGSKIQLLTPPLGEGVEGAVFEIKFKNGNKSHFVVKETNTVPIGLLEIEKNSPALTYRQWLVHGLEIFTIKNSYDIDFIARLNNIPREILNNKVPCDEEILFKFPLLGPSELTTNCHGTVKKYRNFRKGSYVCEGNVVSSLMSALTSVVFIEDRICPHFVQHISFVSCDLLKSYTFMERINFDLLYYLTEKCNNFKTLRRKFKVILFQILVGLSFMQEYLYRGTPIRITHNDLHMGNIFLKSAEEVSWRNEKLNESKWWKYTINKVDFYIPSGKYIIKFGDWGYAAKHSNPRIHRQDCLFKDNERNINISPIKYLKSLDILYFFSISIGRFQNFISPVGQGIIIKEILKLLSHMGPNATTIFHKIIHKKSERIYSGKLALYEKELISCRELLLTDYFSDFREDSPSTKPRRSNKIKDKEDHIEISILN